MRLNGQIVGSWADFRRAVAEADNVPEDAVLTKNRVGNFAILTAEGEYIGYVDPHVPEVVLNV